MGGRNDVFLEEERNYFYLSKERAINALYVERKNINIFNMLHRYVKMCFRIECDILYRRKKVLVFRREENKKFDQE